MMSKTITDVNNVVKIPINTYFVKSFILLIIFLLIYFNKIISKTNLERKLRNDKRISLFQEIFLFFSGKEDGKISNICCITEKAVL